MEIQQQLQQITNAPLLVTEAKSPAISALSLSAPVSAQASLEQDLKDLELLDLGTLQDRWCDAYGQKAPGRLGAEFLRRALAYRLQELALGGPSRQALLRLKAVHQNIARGDRSVTSLPMPPMIKPGTRMLREWQGQTHEVLAIEKEAFVYQEKTYRSLSVIARVITGTHQSGPRFFGLGRHSDKSHGGSKSHGLDKSDG